MSDLQTLVAQEAAKRLATFTADVTVKKVLNYLKSSGGGLPLGHLFAWPFQTPPDGAIQCNGAEYNRALYADFFAHATSKGWVKTEAEWQEIASQNNGYCSYYSDGDGSTTFRTPKFAPFMQVALASGNVGNYHEAGLPALTGKVSSTSAIGAGRVDFSSFGALSTEAISTSWAGYAQTAGFSLKSITLDASKSSTKYGNSDTVQPESIEWMICVVVFGIATNVGSADVGNVMSAVAQVQANPNLQGQAHIVDTWKSGSDWYRVWSDGWIEQGGMLNRPKGSDNQRFPITFLKAFTTAAYSVQTTVSSGGGTGSYTGALKVGNKTKLGLDIIAGFSEAASINWIACGY